MTPSGSMLLKAITWAMLSVRRHSGEVSSLASRESPQLSRSSHHDTRAQAKEVASAISHEARGGADSCLRQD
jgi:hypothetical protein